MDEVDDRTYLHKGHKIHVVGGPGGWYRATVRKGGGPISWEAKGLDVGQLADRAIAHVEMMLLAAEATR